VRYKQAFFGIAWALFRPILNMILFTFLFHRIADLSSKEVSYPLFVLSGMLPWQLFSNAVVDTSNSLLTNAHLISKTYFPRILLPTSQVMLHLLDFAIGTVLLIALIVITGTPTGWSFFTFPLFVLLLVTFSVGLAIWLSALTIRYRDVRFIIPFVVQFGIFISPVGYGSFVIPDKWQWLYALNPMVGIIDGFRWAFFGTSTPYLVYSISTSTIISVLTLLLGFLYFRKTERTFADQL
jgi:lipopolysaccharide transport system permease protein